MITPKIKALFQFIEFLHSNIENFKQYDEVINELQLLGQERNKLDPEKNFADKLKYDKVQAKIKHKIPIIDEKINEVIKLKALELNICEWNKTETLWNWNSSEILKLRENFSESDIPEILQHKSKYIEFRTKMNCDRFLGFFFPELDKLLKFMFDFFKEGKQNEFEAFETKSIQANDFREAADLIEKGHKKITLPIDFLNPSKVQQNDSDQLPPHQTESLIDPLEYIKFSECEFYSNLTKQNNCTQETATQLYQVVINLLVQFKQARADSIKTEEIIDQQSKVLNNTWNWNLVEHWLIKAIQNNDTYKYAYNLLAISSNRRSNWHYHQVKIISDIELFKLLKNEPLPPPPITKPKTEFNETELSEKIKKHFEFLLSNCPRKGKPILSNEDDFNNLINWTKYFFENNFEVPEIPNPIKTVSTNIYITQLAFQILFDELRKSGFHTQRTYAKTLFNLWEGSFLDYKGYKEKNFWKVKKKNDSGPDYDTEVKKLMFID